MRPSSVVLLAALFSFACDDASSDPAADAGTVVDAAADFDPCSSPHDCGTGPDVSVPVDAAPDATPDGEPDAGDAEPAPDAAADAAPPPPRPDCDPIVPTYCMFPFPNDYFRGPDGRLNPGAGTLPTTTNGRQIPPDLAFEMDGFSPGATLLAHLPGATGAGLPGPQTIADSLAADSPTVLIDAETGARIPHFAELDAWSDDPERRGFMIRPVVRLADATRYIVAIRGVVDVDGQPLAPSDAFLALRDGDGGERQAHFDDLFGRLGSASVARDTLQLAWDFTVASDTNNTRRMLAMRDDALADLPEGGAHYRIVSVERDVSEDWATRIEAVLEVPVYLDDPGIGGTLVLDDDELPVRQGVTEYPFLVLVPRSTTPDSPATPIQFGHGLFGRRDAAEGLGREANAANLISFSMDWIGMSRDDVPVIGAAIASGNVENFATVPDRLQQSMVNLHVLARTIVGSLLAEPELQVDGRPLYDPTALYYVGGSQGGIFGTTYLALSPDIERGVLAVPGQAFSLMLPRSIHFDPFAQGIGLAFSDPLDMPALVGFAQMLWDRAEPNGYAHHLRSDNLLPGVPAKRVLLIEAIGDHQVPNLSTHLLARSIGARHLAPVNREIFGLEASAPPFDGHAMVGVDFGLPPVPLENLPMREGDDPHGDATRQAPVIEMMRAFLLEDRITMPCDGPCDPE